MSHLVMHFPNLTALGEDWLAPNRFQAPEKGKRPFNASNVPASVLEFWFV